MRAVRASLDPTAEVLPGADARAAALAGELLAAVRALHAALGGSPRPPVASAAPSNFDVSEGDPAAAYRLPTDRSIGALLVVGDPARRDAMASWLDAAGVRLAATGDPRTARTLFGSAPENYDLVVIDTQLPGADGMPLVRALREVRVRLPVVLLSDESPDQVATHLPAARGDAETVVLQPSVTPQRLTAIVRELLRSAAR